MNNRQRKAIGAKKSMTALKSSPEPNVVRGFITTDAGEFRVSADVTDEAQSFEIEEIPKESLKKRDEILDKFPHADMKMVATAPNEDINKIYDIVINGKSAEGVHFKDEFSLYLLEDITEGEIK